MLVVVATDLAPELKMLVLLHLLFHHLLVRPDSLSQIALVDVPRKNVLVLADLATLTFKPALDEFI